MVVVVILTLVFIPAFLIHQLVLVQVQELQLLLVVLVLSHLLTLITAVDIMLMGILLPLMMLTYLEEDLVVVISVLP